MFHRQIPKILFNNIIKSSPIKHSIISIRFTASNFLSMGKGGQKLNQRGHRQESNSSLTSNSRSIKSSGSLKSLSTQIQSTLSSLPSNVPLRKMKIYPIKALQDNYMYLLVDEPTKQAAAVDPVNASAMASAIADYGVDLKCILTTHHHYDHANGNGDMVSMYPDIIVYGGDQRVQALTKTVSHSEIIRLGTLTIECLSTPCHTRGHICYYVHNEDSTRGAIQTFSTTNNSQGIQAQDNIMNNSDFPASPPPPQSTLIGSASNNGAIERAVFTGDTLFIAGCGRFFEGSSEQMDHNLNVLLGGLPAETRVYCGHEYTVTNLKFALTVEPQNSDIKMKLDWAQGKVAKREPTVPSTIGEEKRINPFMRLNKPQVRKFTKEQSDLEVMSVLRRRKNEFQP